MITVVADDLSGAAEVAGAAHRLGLAAEVQTAPHHTSAALCLDADTRALPPEEAEARAGQLARLLAERAAPRFVKVDSVLRGPVAATLAGLLRAFGLPRALLVPANPGRGRVIAEGQYLIHGQPLSQTEFARDPEHPALTAEVAALLGQASPLPVHVVRPGAALPADGLVVGEAASPADLAHWAGRIDGGTLPAGAAEFFEAWLRRQGRDPAVRPAALDGLGRGKALLVSGSTSAASRDFCRDCEARGVPVLRMPPELFAGAASAVAEARWEAATRRALAARPLVVVAIDQPRHPAPDWPARLRASLAALVASVLAGGGVDQLLLEGGATARAIVDRLGWVRLRVRAELAPGIVALQPIETPVPLVVLKPGSYAWPNPIQELPYAFTPPTH